MSNTQLLVRTVALLAVTSLLQIGVVCSKKTEKTDSVQEKILSRLLVDYEKRLRPLSGVSPLIVNATMYVVSIGPVSEVDMTFKLSLYFRQFWNDKRLNFYNETVEKLVLSQDVVDSLWIPDSFFQTETESYVHDVTKKNIFFRLDKQGGILMSMRVTVTSRCPMDLAYFPMDVQKCVLRIASWGYTADDIQYLWVESTKEDPIQISDDITLANFQVMNLTYRSFDRSLTTGNWSTLEASFVFGRNTLYFIIQMYIPSTLIVMVSWVSFWVARTAIPARAALGITTVLTLLTLISSTNANMPKISYMKAIDVYLAGCFLFVFASLIEFAVVCYMDQQMPQKRESAKIKRQIDKSRYEIQELLHSDIVLIRKHGAPIGQRVSNVNDIEMDPRHYYMQNNCIYPEEHFVPQAPPHHPSSCEHNTPSSGMEAFCGGCGGGMGTQSQGGEPGVSFARYFCRRFVEPGCQFQMDDVGAIDSFSRWFFPLAFFTLMFGYWAFYLTRDYTM